MPAPAAPTNLSVSSASASAVVLAWTAVAGADSYNVKRAKAQAGGWAAFEQVNVAAVLTNGYTDNAANSAPDPVAGSTYIYMVTAVDGADEGPASNVVAATFVAAAQRPDGDLEDELADMITADPLAEDATYTRYGYAPATVRGWFDNPSTENKGQHDGQTVQNAGPQFTCATADVENAGNRDTLALDGITYYVTGVEPDGTGLTVLKLSRHAPR